MIVLEREVEAGFARVYLSPGAAAQLVVDARRLVALGADDAQPPSTRTAWPSRSAMYLASASAAWSCYSAADPSSFTPNILRAARRSAS